MHDCLLFTINVGGVLTDNSRTSFLAACERWGCGYHEVTAWNQGQPGMAKLASFTLTDAERLMILDADSVISSACPSPFETFPASDLVVVGITPRVDRGGVIRSYAHDREWLVFSRSANVPEQPMNGWEYFNAGMLIASRTAHAALFAEALNLMRHGPALAWAEQTPLNYACKLRGVVPHVADERWNYMRPDLSGGDWADLLARDIYVMHLAGMTDRPARLAQLRWHAPVVATPPMPSEAHSEAEIDEPFEAEKEESDGGRRATPRGRRG